MIARVLAGTLDEFAGVPVELVQAELIEGEPTLDAPMGRDDPGRPLLLADEDAVVGEGLVRFDVRARARVPDGDGEPRLMELDVEPQGRMPAGYPPSFPCALLLRADDRAAGGGRRRGL